MIHNNIVLHIVEAEPKDLYDYKFFCFDGVVKYFKIDFGRFSEHHANYYDAKGQLQSFGEVVCPPIYSKEIEMPKSLSSMILLAESLSKGLPFIRIDFYDINGNIYFGEYTFSPAGGMGPFTDSTVDIQMGEWINLSKIGHK